MRRFANERVARFDAYIPGEQPRGGKYIKLNTNESPYPPSPRIAAGLAQEANLLNLYPDPGCTPLVAAASGHYGIDPECLIFTNGSDELLNFALLAFCGRDCGIAFPDITYGLYAVLCEMYGIPYQKIPLAEDFSINPREFCSVGKNIMLANPNAPTGLCLSAADIEMIVASNPDNVVIVDEAYIAFGGESCLRLIDKYDNLLLTRTFSKSHSLAGARLGMGIGSAGLIADLNKVRYSFNPYNINRITMLAGVAAIEDDGYYMSNCRTICRVRESMVAQMRARGFYVTESKANFLFARHPDICGGELYEKLRKCGILIRHFNSPRISDYIRITVGTEADMKALNSALGQILSEI